MSGTKENINNNNSNSTKRQQNRLPRINDWAKEKIKDNNNDIEIQIYSALAAARLIP